MWKKTFYNFSSSPKYINTSAYTCKYVGLQRAESVSTARPRLRHCGGGMATGTTCVTPVAFITKWTVRTGRWSSQSEKWWVQPINIIFFHYLPLQAHGLAQKVFSHNLQIVEFVSSILKIAPSFKSLVHRFQPVIQNLSENTVISVLMLPTH